MSDEIRITGLEEWPNKAIRQLREQLPEGVVVNTGTPFELSITMPKEWPPAKRTAFHHEIQKPIQRMEHDWDCSATVEAIEKTDKEDRQEVGFE